MTLYVVTQGEYSDYHIVGIYSDRETAEKIRKYKSVRDDMCEIEEYELNPNLPKDVDEIKEYWVVNAHIRYKLEYPIRKYLKETVWNTWIEYFMERDSRPDIEYTFSKDCYEGKVYISKSIAKDKDHAIKIAQDIRAKVIAEQEGL